MNRRLLTLYPRNWRERYGSEVADLADELIAAGDTTPLRAGLDLFAGAAAERWRVITSRAVLAPAAAAAAVTGGIALAVTRTLHGAGETRPYFDAHPVGLLVPVIMLGWVLMEAGEFVRGRRSRHWRDQAAGTGQRTYWLAIGACTIVTTLMMYLAPPVIPAAAIQPGGGAALPVVDSRRGSRWLAGHHRAGHHLARAGRPGVGRRCARPLVRHHRRG